MAAPVIYQVIPGQGPSYGRNLVAVAGENFREPPPPPTGGPVPPYSPPVRVRFDGETALRVDALAPTLLRVLVPPYRGAAIEGAWPAVDVEVANLDLTGAPISGETTTFAGAYLYKRPALRPPDEAAEPPYRAVVRETLLLFARHVLPNVARRTHTDFAEEGATITLDAKLPALYIGGPRLRENRIWMSNEFIDVEVAPGRSERRPPHLVVDFAFTLAGMSDSDREALSLMAATTEMLERMPWLDVDDPATGARLRFPLEVTEQPRADARASGSNLVTFSASFEVRAVPIVSAFPEGWLRPVEEILGQVQQDVDATEVLEETPFLT